MMGTGLSEAKTVGWREIFNKYIYFAKTKDHIDKTFNDGVPETHPKRRHDREYSNNAGKK